MSTLKVDAIRHNSATSDAITTAADGTCTAKITSINGGSQLSHRNKVINGAMLINQRATSYTDTGTSYTLDRFRHRTSGLNFDTTTTQDSSAPDGFKKSLKVTPDSVQTPSGGHNGVFETKLEGQDVQDFAHGTSSAKQMTISFYAKSSSQNNNHNYSFQIIKVDVGGSNGRYVLQPFTVTSSWQKFTFTFPGDTSNAIIDGNVKALRLVWNLSSGPSDLVSATNTWTVGDYWRGVTGMNNFMDNTSNEFYLTGVQLEVGDTATSFEHRTYQDEFLRCCRYYYKLEGRFTAAGRGAGSSAYLASISTPVPLRSQPTIGTGTNSESESFSVRVYKYDGISDSTNTPTVGTRGWMAGNNHITLYQTGHSVVDDRVLNVYMGGGYIDFDSELT